MKSVEVEIRGVTPLLQHKMTEDQIFALLGAKGKKKAVGDEKTPREIAEQHAYKNQDGSFCIPMEYVSGAFAAVASDYKQQNSQRKSYKAIAKGIFRPSQAFATLTDEDDKPLMAFEVDVRKATNHQKGAVAVCRPRFDRWKARFSVEIDDTIISPKVAHDILADSGKRAGIGSFRVQRGGYFGQFQITHWKEM